MSSITIREVAKKANVGVGTVSRVLNGSPSVSPATRQRVLDVIEELDFVPNPAAQRLKKGQTHAISVLLPYLTLPSFVERLRGVQSILNTSEYDLVLYSAVNAAHRDHLFDLLSLRSRSDGIIIISIRPNQNQIKKLKKSSLPFVLIDSFHSEIPSIYVNNEQGGQLATQHLIDLGHERIAFISDYIINDFNFSAMKERFFGFESSMKNAGLKIHEGFHIQVPHDREAARRAALELLNRKQPPTAIFASSDIQAIGVLDAARQLSIQVPIDLSVIGFDDVRDSEYVNLTTIRQPLFDSGSIGTQLLLNIIENKEIQKLQINQELRLVPRNTTSTCKL